MSAAKRSRAKRTENRRCLSCYDLVKTEEWTHHTQDVHAGKRALYQNVGTTSSNKTVSEHSNGRFGQGASKNIQPILKQGSLIVDRNIDRLTRRWCFSSLAAFSAQSYLSLGYEALVVSIFGYAFITICWILLFTPFKVATTFFKLCKDAKYLLSLLLFYLSIQNCEAQRSYYIKPKEKFSQFQVCGIAMNLIKDMPQSLFKSLSDRTNNLKNEIANQEHQKLFQNWNKDVAKSDMNLLAKASCVPFIVEFFEDLVNRFPASYLDLLEHQCFLDKYAEAALKRYQDGMSESEANQETDPQDHAKQQRINQKISEQKLKEEQQRQARDERARNRAENKRTQELKQQKDQVVDKQQDQPVHQDKTKRSKTDTIQADAHHSPESDFQCVYKQTFEVLQKTIGAGGDLIIPQNTMDILTSQVLWKLAIYIEKIDPKVRFDIPNEHRDALNQEKHCICDISSAQATQILAALTPDEGELKPTKELSNIVKCKTTYMLYFKLQAHGVRFTFTPNPAYKQMIELEQSQTPPTADL